MHRSTRLITGIELASLLLVVASNWLSVSAVLRTYLQATVLGCAVVVGAIGLGWAKPRGVENQNASRILILSAAVFQVALFFLLGVKLGFVANIYRFNLISIMQVWLPLCLIIIFTEILRGQMVARGHQSRGILVLTTVVSALLQITVLVPAYLPMTAQNGCELGFTVALPAALTSLLLTYIAYNYDYRANIIYRLIIELPVYLLPIYPDVDAYLVTAFSMMLVVALTIVFIYHQKLDESRVSEPQARRSPSRPLDDIRRKRLRCIGYTMMGVGLTGFLCFCGLMSGLFHYFFLAIESGSMEPAVRRGDLILVERTDAYSQIVNGTVLVYRYKNLVVVHRVSEVEYDGEKYQYKTKGDANMSEDVWVVEQSDIIGIAKTRISLFGYPTVWLSELFNGGK